jgi:CBS domain-containing protein
MTVARILQQKGRNVVTSLPSETLHKAIARLTEHNIGALVVVDWRGGVRGIVSERDIVRLIARHGDAVLNDPLSKHMTTNVRACRESDSIDWVMNEMTEYRGRHIPVIEGGRLTGLVSIGDVVKLKLAECAFETQALREYITA